MKNRIGNSYVEQPICLRHDGHDHFEKVGVWLSPEICERFTG
jgi:hypothetical protein